MRRFTVFPLLATVAAAAALVVCVLVLVGPAGAAPRAHIVCPQRAYVVPPCCPLPPSPQIRSGDAQPVCCQQAAAPCCPQSNTCCPEGSGTCCTQPMCGPLSLTVASSPNPSRAGQKVVISGTGTAGAQIALWRKLATQSSFHQVSTTTADSSGKYTFTLKRGTVKADQQWYVTSGGVQSQTVSQQVHALVSVQVFSLANLVTLRGHVTPSHAGEVVLVEMSRGGAWRVLARPRLGHGSNFVTSHRFARSGTIRFRVVLRADRRNVQSTSGTFKIPVK